jgi:hypothetical protein
MSGRSTSKFNKIITYLQQKLVDTETANKTIFSSGEDNLPENIDTFDISQERDLGIRTTLKTTGNIYRMVTGADSKNLRCWIKFTNAAKLYDYSRSGLTSYVYGLGQIPILNMKNVSQNVLGYEFESYFNGHDQYAYTDDHERIRVSDMFADSEVSHISFFDRFYPISVIHKITAENSVLFSKVDDDQLKDGYAATMTKKGDLIFYVRRNFKQYSLFLKGVYEQLVNDELQNGGDYLASNYSSQNFQTDETYSQNLLCSIALGDDHWFVYDKATNGTKYILNGVDLTPTPFTVAPILDVPFQDGAYNTDGSDRTVINDISSGNYNGTLSNPTTGGQWKNDNTYFAYGGNSSAAQVNFATIAALDSANEYTIAFQFKPDNITNTSGFSEWIVSKNYAGNGSLIIYRMLNSSNIQAQFKDSTGAFHSATITNAITSTDWHTIIAKYKAGEKLELIVNGVSALSSTFLPANINTGGTVQVYRATAAIRGTVSYLKIWTSKLGTADTQKIIDEGYHNPTFPKSEKPQPEPVEIPPPIVRPFEVFYNLASETAPFSPTATNTVWLNSIEGDSPFTEVYNVADGVDESFPEEAIYDVADGDTGGSEDPFQEQYNLQSSDNSAIELSSGDNDAGGVGVQSGSGLIGDKITRAIFYLRRVGSASGSVYCRIWNASDNTFVTLDYWNGSSLGTLNASNVSTNWTAYEFRNTTFNWSTSSLQAGWTVGIEFTGSGQIDVRRRSAATSTEIQHSRDTGTSDFNTNSDYDVAAILYSGGGTSASDPLIYMEYVQKIGGGSSNTYLYDRILEKFGTGDGVLSQIPTKVKVKMKKTGSGHSGTIHCYLCSGHTGSVVEAEFGSAISASSISTTLTEYTFTLPENTKSITNGWNIMLFWESMPSSSTAKIGVMTNTGVSDPHPPAPASNTVSYVQKYGYVPGFENLANHLLNYTSIDLSGKIFIGGNEFDSTVSFTSAITRYYIKGTSSTTSAVVGKKLTKGLVRARKVGSPTGLMTCNVRDNDANNTVRFSLGTFDVATLDDVNFGDVIFSNVFNTLSTEINDRICFEYLGATDTDYVELKINKDVFEGLNTIGGSYSSPSNTDNAQIDLSGKLYTGGEPDINSRIRVGQKIIVDDDSVMDGNKLTKIGVWLINPDAVLGNINCIVYRGSDDSPIVTIGDPIAASTIGAAYEYVEFENVNNGYVLDQNDVVAIVFNGGSPEERLGVHVRQSTGYDGANSYVVRYNGQEYDNMEDYDLVATMWFGGDTYQPPAGTQPDPTPTNNKALLYCAGNNLLSGFARVAQREFAIYSEDTTEEEALNKYNNRYSKTNRSAAEVLLAGLYRPF